MTSRGILALAFSVPLATTDLSGQSFIVTPPGSANKGSGNYSIGIGAHAEGRSQLVDGTLRGRLMLIDNLSFRLRSPTSGHFNPGRSWRRVSLDMVETDLAGFSETYSANFSRVPTRVFSGPVSLPFVTGRHVSVPAPWSLHFPFRRPWAYTGTEDLLADFDYEGGQLSNGKPWGTRAIGYLWDAPISSPVSFGSFRIVGNVGTGGCLDSAASNPNFSARVNLSIFNHHPQDSISPLAGRVVFEGFGTGFGPIVPTLTLLGLKQRQPGFAWPGITCNRLHVDFSVPTLLGLVIPSRSGVLDTHHPGMTSRGVPFQAAWVGQAFVYQAGWHDSATGQFKLSSAAKVEMPAVPVFVPRLVGMHSASKVRGVPSSHSRQNPVRRYRF